MVGQRIGRYQIEGILGKGGMATVYRALDLNTGQEVAMKFIRREAVAPEYYEKILRRFQREAREVIAQLDHANIVSILDSGEVDGSPYLVMKYYRRGALQIDPSQPWTWRKAVRLILPVAQALEYAHKKGFVHRDVKPANILLTESGNPILADFGIAALLDPDEDTRLTSTGLAIGTPDYMAPEQWEGQAGVQSDVYSLGMVLYEMVTGQRPFHADTPQGAMKKTLMNVLPPPGRFAAGLPDEVERVICTALAKDPQERYPGMEAFAQALEELLEGRTESAETQTAAQPALQSALGTGTVIAAGTPGRPASMEKGSPAGQETDYSPRSPTGNTQRAGLEIAGSESFLPAAPRKRLPPALVITAAVVVVLLAAAAVVLSGLMQRPAQPGFTATQAAILTEVNVTITARQAAFVTATAVDSASPAQTEAAAAAEGASTQTATAALSPTAVVTATTMGTETPTVTPTQGDAAAAAAESSPTPTETLSAEVVEPYLGTWTNDKWSVVPQGCKGVYQLTITKYTANVVNVKWNLGPGKPAPVMQVEINLPVSIYYPGHISNVAPKGFEFTLYNGMLQLTEHNWSYNDACEQVYLLHQ